MAVMIGTSGADNLNSESLGNSNDTLKGLGGDDTLFAGDGKDKVEGGAGADILGGGFDAFVDTVLGGVGDDIIVAGSSDVMEGGDGFDAIEIWETNETSGRTINANNLTGAAVRVVTVDALYASMTVSGFEYVNVYAGSGGDTITMGNSRGFVDARAGNDTVTASGQNDYVKPGLGDDVVNGGGGIDRVGYYGIAGGVTVSLALQGTAQDTGAGMDTLTNFEDISGTAEGDLLTGDGKANGLWGQGGDDTINGGAGNDLIWLGSTGTQLVDGGKGIDSVIFNNNGGFAGFTDGMRVDLNRQGVIQDLGQTAALLRNIENVSGGDFDDFLKGAAGVNVLAGDHGDDMLTGGGGADSLYGDGRIKEDGHNAGPITFYKQADGAFGADFLYGGTGNDILVGGLGQDMLSGGAGSDTFLFLDTADSAPGASDYIADLSNLRDAIDLSAIDADEGLEGDQAFVVVGALSGAAGEMCLTYDEANDVTLLSLNASGGGVDMVIEIAGEHAEFNSFVL